MTDKRPVFVVMNCVTLKCTTESYSNIKNVIRFGLAKDTYEAGQYDIYPTDPETGEIVGKGQRAYKRVQQGC